MAAVGVRKNRSPRAKYGEIPLSSGEVEYLTRKDEAERRRQRLLAVRDRERLVAQQVTQRYRANLRKLQQRKLQEAQTVNKEHQDVLLSELHRKYQSSLQNMGSAQRNAREKLLELLELAQQEQQKWSYNEKVVEKARNGKAAEELDEEQQASMARRKEIDANMQRLKELSTKQRTLANERARREIEMQLQTAREKEDELAWKRKNEPEEVITMDRPHRKDVTAYHFTRLHCLATPAIDPIVSARPAVKIIRHNTSHPSAANASEEAAKYRDQVDQRQEQNRVKMELNLQQATNRGNNALNHDENKKNGEKVMEWLAMLRTKERQELMQHTIDESREQHLDEEAAEAAFARMFGIQDDFFLESSTYSVDKAKSIDRVRVSWPKSAEEKPAGTVIEKLTQIENFESRRQANSHSLKESRGQHTQSRISDRVVPPANDLPKGAGQYRVTEQRRRRPVADLDLNGEDNKTAYQDESFDFTQNRVSGSNRRTSIKRNMVATRHPSNDIDEENMGTEDFAATSSHFENEDTQNVDHGRNLDFDFTESVAPRRERVSGLNRSAENDLKDDLLDKNLAFGSSSSSLVDVGTRRLDYIDKSEQDQMRAHSSPFSSSMESESFSSSNGDEHDDERGFAGKSKIGGKENKSPNSTVHNDEYAPRTRQPVASELFHETKERNDYLRTSSNLISSVNEEQKKLDQSQPIDRRTTVLDYERSFASSQDESFDSFQHHRAENATRPTIQRTRAAMPTQIDENGDSVKPDFFVNVTEHEENTADQEVIAQSHVSNYPTSRDTQYTASRHSDDLDDGDDSLHDRLSLSSRSSVSRYSNKNHINSAQQSKPTLTHSFLSSKRAHSLSSVGIGEHGKDVDGSIEHEKELLDEELGELYAEKIRQTHLNTSDRRESSVYVPQYSLPHSDSMSSFDGSFYEREEDSFVNKLVPMFPNGIPSRRTLDDTMHVQEQFDVQLIDPSLSRIVGHTKNESPVNASGAFDHRGTSTGDDNSNSASGVSSLGFSAQLQLIAGSSTILNFERGIRSAESSMRGSLVGFLVRGSEAEFEAKEQRKDDEGDDDARSVDQYSIVSSSSSSSLSMEARFKYLVSMAAASSKSLPVHFNPPAAFGDRDMSAPPAPINWKHRDVDEGESIQEEWHDDHSTHSKSSEQLNDQRNHSDTPNVGSLAPPSFKMFDMSVPPAPSNDITDADGYHIESMQESLSLLPPVSAKNFDMSVPPSPLNVIIDADGYHTERMQENVSLLPPVPANNFDMSIPPLPLDEDNDENVRSSVSSGRQYSSSESSHSTELHGSAESQSMHNIMGSLPPRSFGSTNMSRPPAPIINLRSSSSSSSRSNVTRTDKPRGLESEEEKEDSASEISSQDSVPRSAGLVSSEILEPSYSRRKGDIMIISSSGASNDRGNIEQGSLEPNSRSTSLADALRSRRPDFLRRMENRQEAIKSQRRLSTGNDEVRSTNDNADIDRQRRLSTIASSTAAPLELNPQQDHLLGRLASGERAKVSSKEMKDRTKRLYQQLPEVIERKRQEEILRRRRQRLNELRDQEKARRMKMKQRREKQRG